VSAEVSPLKKFKEWTIDKEGAVGEFPSWLGETQLARLGFDL